MKGALNFRINTRKERIEEVDFQEGPEILLFQLSSIIDAPVDLISLFFGFPKKSLDINSQNKPLKQYKLSPNELVIVQIKEAPPPQKKEEAKQKQINYDQVPDQDGLVMIRRIIPADNSCLFNCISKAILGDFSLGKQYRELVSNYITNNQTRFTKLELDKEPKQYAEWILQDTAWGGQPQLFILSNQLDIEIVAISVQNLRHHCYGSKKEKSKTNRIYVLYDGIHYDLLTKNSFDQAPEESDTRILPGSDNFALQGAMILAKELHAKSQFTDVTKFALVCLVCRKPLTGEAQAVLHGQETGHSNFTQIQK